MQYFEFIVLLKEKKGKKSAEIYFGGDKYSAEIYFGGDIFRHQMSKMVKISALISAEKYLQ